ncbi:tyrosine-type recombinase/integrase [Streptomyces sp. N35]|uniref:tyrosine-type recombinase/integrase n=1 Tax=Streptomyces sp. N35 TaxID=2795730 RepID=UPI0018F6049D|nr:tyrosine-type recombinase/integrase [Streptomyces sp. N35]
MAHAEKRTWDKRARKWRYRGRYKLPNGKWASVSRDDNGQPFYTARSAEDYAHGLEVDVRRQKFIDPKDGRITVRAWAELWIESVELGPVSERGYRSRLNSVILPEWGDAYMSEVSAVAVATWIKKIRAQYSKDHADGVVSVFRVMFDDAVRSKVRGDNPIPSRRSGRRGRYTPKPKSDRVIATPRQALLVARNARELFGLNEYVMVLAKAYTGFRIAELAGIHRTHLALQDEGIGARIHMSQQGQYVDGSFTEIHPKYDSRRGLIIPPFLATLVQELIDSRPQSEWVFTGPEGGRLLRGGGWYKRVWQPITAGAGARPAGYGGRRSRSMVRPVLGVEALKPHGLRHSHKVWLDEQGHPKVAVEERLGHTIGGVEGVYSHTTLSMELKISESLQSLWEASLMPVIDRREFGPIPPPLALRHS